MPLDNWLFPQSRFMDLAQAFQLVLEAAGAKAATTAFFDDSARNVAAGHAAGLFSVLVGPLCQLADMRILS